ncbi:DNA helicase-4 [Hymenobacter luteus]|uniref:DNA 3'-5' helicase n=2 Tax=Hymenobacter TaxID=89966 RepID=A0A7W9WC00_9BACT|nr:MULTISPECIES: UvrD-helicase domain-containing protein [Hymenobacter]MBB4600927.1 DNA helicase-4 [Hymenobacter latericoloratus]MBB6058866.1 DNA helicase-4 [Hymenobacter luteus]
MALRLRLEEVEQAERAFRHYLVPEAGYFRHYVLHTWQGQYEELKQAVEAGQYLKTDLSATEKGLLTAFVSYYADGEAMRAKFNQGFVARELARYDALFSRVEGRSLDEQQRKAIVSDEDNNLVVAGAGSGKTTTIVGKVQYVLDRYRVAPERILLISFTNKSAATLAERIGIAGIEPRTFHKFGKDIITAVEGRQPSLYDENQLNTFIAGALQDLLRQPAYAELVIDFFLRQLKPQKPNEAFRSRGEYIQFLRDFGMQPYRATKQEANGRVTYQREAVKSAEECHIANFLYLNNIEYYYEAPYEHPTATAHYAQWKPDFTIVQDGKRVYLEHFGVDKNGNVPAFFAKSGQSVLEARTRYWEKIEWARQTSRKHGTMLLETYSYQHSEHRLTEALRKQLEEYGIRLRPKTAAEVWEILSTVAEDEVGSFQTLLRTFLLHLKSSNSTVEQVRARNERVPAVHERERNRHFLAIIEPLVERYAQELARREEIDFNDLINRATDYVRTGRYGRSFDYIIIDEFQDISQGRAQLIRSLTERHPATKLFCVGDDWQSIYRFAGSDLALFTNFGQHFGHSLLSRIETTYRFHEPLLGQSSTFITRNPSQTPKHLRSGLPGRRTQLRVVATPAGQQDDTVTLVELLEELIATVSNLAHKELLLLGRYSFDFRRIRNTMRVFRVDATRSTLYYDYTDAAGRPQTLQLPFLTVHKSKGLEADIVVVLNCNTGRRGFPSEMADDPVLGLVLSTADQFANGEERRLFYVALTRAKEQVFLLSDPTSKSKFVLELEGQGSPASGSSVGRRCPACQTTELVLKTGVSAKGKPWSFYGCPNFAYGCDYQEWVKPVAKEIHVN